MAVTRRVVNWLLGGSFAALAASILYPIVRFIVPPEMPEATVNQVEAGPTNDPAFLDTGFKIVRFGNQPVIVVRITPEEYRAFDGVCTHLDCIVEYQQDKSRIWCNCHNGEYNLQGEVVAGPPPHALERYEVHLADRGVGQAPMVVVQKA